MKFRTWLENNQSYEDFVNWLQQSGQDVNTLVTNLMQKKPDEKGGNANFWRIPGSDQYGLRVVRSNKAPGEMSKFDDPAPEIPRGQPVAELGKGFQIVKIQQGTPAGFRHGREYRGDKKEIAAFKDRIFQIAAIPKEAYLKLTQQLVQMNKRGLLIDPSKAGNILVTPQGFNLVDVNKTEDPESKNIGSWLPHMLIGNYDFNKYLRQEEEARKAVGQIVQKIRWASDTAGLPWGYSSSAEYSQQLTQPEPKREPIQSIDPEIWE
jgi:hypothetical protein